MSKTLIEIQNGHKTFQQNQVLQNINLTIESGDFISFLGSSGSGKTTLLRLIAGLESWTSGNFNIDQTLTAESAFVFQEPNLLTWRNVLENVLLPLELNQQQHHADQGLEVLKKVHLEHAATLYPHQLSGGMKMRVSIARALVTKPRLLFMDEPFAALDEPTREELQEQLREIWEQNNTTILFVTHSIQEATFLSRKILFLRERPASIGEHYIVELPKKRDRETRSSEAYFNQLKVIRNHYKGNAHGNL